MSSHSVGVYTVIDSFRRSFRIQGATGTFCPVGMGEVALSTASSVQMEGEWSTEPTLPEELVGRVLAMVPFPQIFKARVLSKSWRARFDPIASQDDKAEMHLATWFQEQVGEWSCVWKTFYPSVIFQRDVTAYDQASFLWHRMPLLSFLPKYLFTGRSGWRLEGSLLLVRYLEKRNGVLIWDLYVANILTRSWKPLPPRPHAKSAVQLLIHMKPTYKVIDFEEDWGAKQFSAHIYDPKLDAWSSMKLSRSFENTSNLSSWAHLDGVLYRVVGPSCLTGNALHVFSVKERTFEELQMSPSIDTPAHGVQLVVCNGSLLMLVYNTSALFGNPKADSVRVVKIDLASRKWLEVTRGPPAALRFCRFYAEAGIDHHCLIFAGEDVGSGLIAYDVKKDEWSRTPAPTDFRLIDDVTGRTLARQGQGPFCFMPGLNPFAAV